MNDLPNPVPLTDYWRQQVESWKNSNQSQTKFCQINELSYHRFVYWRRKFDALCVNLIPYTLCLG